MSGRVKQIVKVGARLLITAALLVWVFSQIDLQQFGQAISGTKWQYLMPVWILTAIFFLIRSITLQLMLKKQQCYVSLSTLFGASAVTSLYSMVLPGILSTGVKWHILRKDTGKGSIVLSSMVYNQLSLLVIMAVFGLTALIVTNPTSILLTDTNNKWLLPVISGLLLIVIILITLLFLSRSTGPKIIKALDPLLKPFPQSIRLKAQKVITQIAIFQTAGLRFHLAISFLTAIAALVVGVFTYVLSAKAAHITAEVGVLVWTCAIIFLLGRLPISVANLGVREVTLVGIMTIYGVDKSSALLMSIILFSSQVFMAIIGAIYQITWMLKTKKRLKASNNGFIKEKL